MHIVGLVDHPGHVCCRYRLAAYRPWLEQAGHRLELRPWPRRWWDWIGLPRRLARADAVILQRRLLRGWQRWLVRRAAPLLLFDFDDAVFLRDSYAPRGLHSAARRRRFAALVRAVDGVTAGNDFLAAQAARWAGPGKVRVLPTCVNPGDYPLAGQRRRGAGVELVWVGSSSTLRGLEAARPLLEEVGRRVPGLRLRLVCDRFFHLEHLSVQLCPWTEAGEARTIAGADIGISHVPDDLWSRGKCGLKVLQYMAAGLPVVANPVGIQADLVRPGVTGFLAQTPEQWGEAIGRLAADPDLRRRLGRAGRQRVERDFSVAAGAARWLDLLGLLPTRSQVA